MPSVMDILADKGSDVYTISPSATVLEATHAMNDQKIGALVVKDGGGRVMGIFTERDVLRRVIAEERSPNAVRVGEVMTRDVVRIGWNQRVTRRCGRLRIKPRAAKPRFVELQALANPRIWPLWDNRSRTGYREIFPQHRKA